MTTEAPSIIDALPYVDSTIDDDEGKRLEAMKEVDDEMDIFPPQRDYIDYLPYDGSRRFKTPLIEHEHSCIENNETRPPASELAIMRTKTLSTSIPTVDDDELADCLKFLKIKLEYRQRQLINLELMKSYGEPAWEQYISESEKLSANLQDEMNNLNKRTQEVNWRRKTDQERTVKTLDLLKTEWTYLADKNRILSEELKRLTGQG